MGATLSTNLKNAEHIQAQAPLIQIIDLNQQAGLGYSTFQRIQLGLKARRNIGDAVDESGAIIAADADEGTPDLDDRRRTEPDQSSAWPGGDPGLGPGLRPGRTRPHGGRSLSSSRMEPVT